MRQRGVVTLAQMHGAGISPRQVERGLERGDLVRLHRGVYRLGPVSPPHCPEMAATLACGANAVLSHRSAAAMYEILDPHPGPIHITVPHRHRRGDAGIVVHETASLGAHEIRERRGIPLTAPIRTLIDLSGACTPEDLERAVSEAFARRLTNLPSLQRAIEAYRGRRGVARIRALLDHGPRLSRSPPERRLLRAIRGAGLPEPETNVMVGRWEVDFLWRDAGLAVEVDAYSTHSSPRAFERDRRKDADLAARGLMVQRFSADHVRDELEYVLAWIAARLAGASRL